MCLATECIIIPEACHQGRLEMHGFSMHLLSLHVLSKMQKSGRELFKRKKLAVISRDSK